MLLSSGLTFGYKKTLPHIFGVMLGFPVMVVLVGLGIGIIFDKFPLIFSVLKIIGMLYLLWMAKKIATNRSKYDIETNQKSKPFSFLQAALFQWVNPKAWIMALTATSVFVISKEDSFMQVLTIAFIYLLSSIISTNLWAMGGVFLKKFIQKESTIHKFNIIMAILLVISMLPVIIG